MKRSEISEKFKWNISDIFNSPSEFYVALDKIKQKIDFSSFKGNLNNAKTIKMCFDKLYSVSGELEVLAVYAMMKKDEDATVASSLELCDKVENLEIQFGTQTAFITPELTSLDEILLKQLLTDETLTPYKRDIEQIIDLKKHVLSEECENLLATSSKVLAGYKKVFSMIDDVDLDCPTILVDGKRIKVTGATYSMLLQHADVNVRKKAFKSYYKAYGKVLNTITAVYNGNVDKNIFIAKARKFNSCIEKALFYEEVDKSVYNTLIESVHEALPLVHKYVDVRRQILGGKINMYDLYVPLVEGTELKLDYNEAFSLVLEGLKPLGEDYISLLKRAKDERWIDVYENEGKRGGAYSVCVHNLKHPFVLLNHTKTTHSVFTIAHELGHAIHSYKSKTSQPIQTSDYKIFVAEVASTVNEILLIKHLIKTAKTTQQKKYFLSYYLDTIRTTLFRQTMFAEFERIAHERVENGESISKEFLNSQYLALNKKYYGKGVVSNKEISFEWARIPHFYSAFYVYKYATGIISAIAIAEKILSNDENAVDKYFKFLSSGSSNTPVELLKLTDVDLNDKATFKNAFKSFEQALEELISLL